MLVFREWLEANKNRWLCQKACAGVRSRKVGKPRLQLYNNTTARPRARGPCPPRSGVSGYDHTTTGCCYPFRITRPSVVRSLLVPASEMGMEQAMLYPTLFVPLFVPLVLWRGAVCTPGLCRPAAGWGRVFRGCTFGRAGLEAHGALVQAQRNERLVLTPKAAAICVSCRCLAKPTRAPRTEEHLAELLSKLKLGK